MNIETVELAVEGTRDVGDVKVRNMLKSMTGTEYNVVELTLSKTVVRKEEDPTFKEFIESNMEKGSLCYRVKAKKFLKDAFNLIFDKYATVSDIADIELDVSNYEVDTVPYKIITSFKNILMQTQDNREVFNEPGLDMFGLRFTYIEYTGLSPLTVEEIAHDCPVEGINLLIKQEGDFVPFIIGLD